MRVMLPNIVASLLACVVFIHCSWWLGAPSGLVHSDASEHFMEHRSNLRRLTELSSSSRGSTGLEPRDSPRMLRERMVDNDPVMFSALSRGRFWVNLTSAQASQSSTYSSSSYAAKKAIDGNRGSLSHTNSQNPSWWQVKLPSRTKVTAVEVQFLVSSSFQQAPVVVSVDGRRCAVIWEIKSGPMKVPFNVPCFGSTLRISQNNAAKYMGIYEVRIEEETTGVAELTPAEINGVICPFLSTLLKEGVLTGCVHTKEALLKATIDSGLEHSKAMAHVEQNFKNIPEGRQDICDMEGAPNEHATSTGINDCITFRAGCQVGHDDSPGKCDIVNTEQDSCGLPNATAFELFFAKLDANKDMSLNMTELQTGADMVDTNDQNFPLGEGTIAGSFGLLLDVFGTNGAIHKHHLATILLQREFPRNSGYVFGKPEFAAMPMSQA